MLDDSLYFLITALGRQEAESMKNSITVLVLLAATVMTTEPAFPETVSFTCRYDSYSNEKGLQKVQDDFRLAFAVDTEKETAQALTDKGKFNVDMLPSPSGGMTFVEMVDGGKVLTTSIDLHGKSVHSRNIILEGRMSPSQYYGTCSKR
jgi:hypothetical protein